MRSYLLRRFLLVPVTLLGITFLVFSITRFLPGGPLEQAQQAAMTGEGGKMARRGGAGATMSDEQKEQLRMEYNLNDGIIVGYIKWLGLLPREITPVFLPLEAGAENTAVLGFTGPDGKAFSRAAAVEAEEYGDGAEKKKRLKLRYKDGSQPDEWQVRYGMNKDEAAHSFTEDQSRAVFYRTGRMGLLQGSLGISTAYGEPVWKLIRERMPVSLFYGLAVIALTYGISIPLGILKAIRHRTFVDGASSVLIFTGFAIPGFVLGTVLLLLCSFRNQWFPIGGFTGEEFESLSTPGKVKDLLHHAALPLLCYVIGGFAFTTMMMKNNLMDVLAADFVRTAVAKGVPFRKAVTGHAVRNAIIPIAASFGQTLTFFVGGSFLIEQVFDINGLGQFSFLSLVHHDYMAVMGTVSLYALLLLLGNILSDILLALFNPRISFA